MSWVKVVLFAILILMAGLLVSDSNAQQPKAPNGNLRFADSKSSSDLAPSSVQDVVMESDNQYVIRGSVGTLTMVAPSDSGGFLSLFRSKLRITIYFVQEMLAALLLFAVLFAPVACVVLLLFLLDRASQRTLQWAESQTRQMARYARHGLSVVGSISRKPHRRQQKRAVNLHPQRYVSENRAAALLGLSPEQLRHLSEETGVGHAEPPGHVWFTYSDLYRLCRFYASL